MEKISSQAKLSEKMKMFNAVQYGNHQPQAATEPLKYGQYK